MDLNIISKKNLKKMKTVSESIEISHLDKGKIFFFLATLSSLKNMSIV